MPGWPDVQNVRPPDAVDADPEYPFQGWISWRGLRLDIENMAGTVRGSKPDRSGRTWAASMPAHYGEIEGTVGADGDAVDVFIGPDLDAPDVWVIQQHRPGRPGEFDEVKCMIGFPSREAAVETYGASYSDGNGFVMGVTRWSAEAFVRAVQDPVRARGRLDRRIRLAPMSKGEQLGLWERSRGPVHVRAHRRGDGTIVKPHHRRPKKSNGTRNLHEQYGHMAVPGPGEKHHGRTDKPFVPEEVLAKARGILSMARAELGDPMFVDILTDALDGDGEARDIGVVADARVEVAETLGIPEKGPRGGSWTMRERWRVTRDAIELALATSPDLAATTAYRYAYGDEAPVHPEMAAADLAGALYLRSGVPRFVTVTKDDAARFIARHHTAFPDANMRGLMYVVGLRVGERLVAVATAGHPTGRWKDPKGVLELTRVASDGTTRNASSLLASRMIDLLPRSGRDGAEGRLFVTYSLTSEEGSTYKALRGKGLRPVAMASAHGEAVRRIRWEAGPDAGEARWDLLNG